MGEGQVRWGQKSFGGLQCCIALPSACVVHQRPHTGCHQHAYCKPQLGRNRQKAVFPATFVIMFISATTFVVMECVFMNKVACFPSWLDVAAASKK
jgi:hypothetical protein